MKHCFICKKLYSPYEDRSFHLFPKDEAMKLKWLSILSLPRSFSVKSQHICSDHFSASCFSGLDGSRRRLLARAAPYSPKQEAEIRSLKQSSMDQSGETNDLKSVSEIYIKTEEHIEDEDSAFILPEPSSSFPTLQQDAQNGEILVIKTNDFGSSTTAANIKENEPIPSCSSGKLWPTIEINPLQCNSSNASSISLRDNTRGGQNIHEETFIKEEPLDDFMDQDSATSSKTQTVQVSRPEAVLRNSTFSEDSKVVQNKQIDGKELMIAINKKLDTALVKLTVAENRHNDKYEMFGKYVAHLLRNMHHRIAAQYEKKVLDLLNSHTNKNTLESNLK